jgi:transposase
VDLESGALLAVTLQSAADGDTKTVHETLAQCGESICEVAAETNSETVGERVNPEGPAELVLDKGYHSNDAMVSIRRSGVRTYCSEPKRGRRNWKGKAEEQAAVYANRRRIRGNRGLSLLRQRGERVERSFAHMYETGAMRRTHLRHHNNIIKRLLIHACAFNLGLAMRKMTGYGTPRGMHERLNLVQSLVLSLRLLWTALRSHAPIQNLQHSRCFV